MKNRHSQLQNVEEEKSPDDLRITRIVPIYIEKPSLEVEDVDYEPVIQIPSYSLCVSVFFILLGLTILVVAVVSNSPEGSHAFGVPLWAVGGVFLFIGLITAFYVMRHLYLESQDERRQIVPNPRDSAEWRSKLDGDSTLR